MLAIDHVIVVVLDLEAAAARLFERHGLASVPGGRHPGHGTGNRIVPLGSTYVELMAVLDPVEASDSPLGRWATHHAGDSFTPAAVCLRTDAIASVAAALHEDAFAMSRRTPSGEELSWRLAGLTGMLEHGWPFFIQWDTNAHPGAAPAQHAVTVGDVSRVGVVSAPPGVDLAGVPGLTTGGRRISAVIPTGTGEVVL